MIRTISNIGPTGPAGSPTLMYWCAAAFDNTLSDRYLQAFAVNAAASPDEATSTQEITTAGIVTRVHATSATGGAISRTFTLRKNGVDTAMTVTLGAAVSAGDYTATTVSVSPGDVLSVKLVLGGLSTNNARPEFFAVVE